VRGWAPDVAKLLWQYVINPVNQLIRTKWNFERELAEARQACANEMTKKELASSNATENGGAVRSFNMWKMDFG